jgi:chromosome partitioning protein
MGDVVTGPGASDGVDWSALGHVYLVANGKGGVGKTTTVSHLGALAAADGLRVLIVDLNGQGNVGEDLGYTGRAGYDDAGRGLFAAVVFGDALRPVAVRKGLDVVPGGEWVSRIGPSLTAEMADPDRTQSALLSLARALAGIAGEYDLVLVDSPPEVALLMQLALCAARFVLVPMKTDESSRKGLRGVAVHFRAMRNHNPWLVLLGVFVFASGTGATRIRHQLRAEVGRDLGTPELLFDAFIRHSEAAGRDVRAHGEPAHEVEQRVDANPQFWELRAGTADADRVVSKTTAGVAADFEALAREVFARAAAVRAQMQKEGRWP